MRLDLPRDFGVLASLLAAAGLVGWHGYELRQLRHSLVSVAQLAAATGRAVCDDHPNRCSSILASMHTTEAP